MPVKNLTPSQPVTYTDKGGGGPLKPHGEDFFERIVGVHWPKKLPGSQAYSFAGYTLLDHVVSRGEALLSDTVTTTSWLGGTLKDGKTWVADRSTPSTSGLGFFCCVRGKVGERFLTVAAGFVTVGPFAFGPGYAVGSSIEPAGGVSDNDGLSWSDAGIPVQEHVISPPNPDTGIGSQTVQGNCSAVAYHPATQTFYIGGTVIFAMNSGWYWEDRLYSGSGGGFSLVSSKRRELFDPFLGFDWPAGGTKVEDRLRVADMTNTTPSGPDVLFVVSFGPNQHTHYITTDNETSYVAVNEDGTGVIFGGDGTNPPSVISPPMALINSVCGGVGSIVAVGWADEDRRIGPVTYVSGDDGKSWVPQLAGLIHENPGIESRDGGSSSGACSSSF